MRKQLSIQGQKKRSLSKPADALPGKNKASAVAENLGRFYSVILLLKLQHSWNARKRDTYDKSVSQMKFLLIVCRQKCTCRFFRRRIAIQTPRKLDEKRRIRCNVYTGQGKQCLNHLQINWRKKRIKLFHTFQLFKFTILNKQLENQKNYNLLFYTKELF